MSLSPPGPGALFWTSERFQQNSTTLRVHTTRPRCRQVLECGRASAAFPLTPAALSGNLDTIFTRFRAEANGSKNFVLRPVIK